MSTNPIARKSNWRSSVNLLGSLYFVFVTFLHINEFSNRCGCQFLPQPLACPRLLSVSPSSSSLGGNKDLVGVLQPFENVHINIRINKEIFQFRSTRSFAFSQNSNTTDPIVVPFQPARALRAPQGWKSAHSLSRGLTNRCLC